MQDVIPDPTPLYEAESLHNRNRIGATMTEQLTLPLSVETVDAPALEYNEIIDAYQDDDLEIGRAHV